MSTSLRIRPTMAAVEAERKNPASAMVNTPQVSSLKIVIKLNPKKRMSSEDDDDGKPNLAVPKAKKRPSIVNGGRMDNMVQRTKETKASASPSPLTQKQSKPSPSTPEKANPQIFCSLRNKVREQLYQGLCKVAAEEAMGCDPSAVAVSVERALFNKWRKFNGKHKLRYRSVLFNIKDSNNPDFRRKVLIGEIKPEAITEMSTEEMASERRKEEVKQIRLRALARNGSSSEEDEATTDQFQCLQCKKRATKYRLLQIRSADEPMTALITCVNCGHVWKEE